MSRFCRIPQQFSTLLLKCFGRGFRSLRLARINLTHPLISLLPRHRGVTTPSSLHLLFSRHGRKPLKKKEIETRIATILNELDIGGAEH